VLQAPLTAPMGIGGGQFQHSLENWQDEQWLPGDGM
jgi:hypothetical protein